jgi:hypothetical protein
MMNHQLIVMFSVVFACAGIISCVGTDAKEEKSGDPAPSETYGYAPQHVDCGALGDPCCPPVFQSTPCDPPYRCVGPFPGTCVL